MFFNRLNRLFCGISALVLASQSLPALSKTPTPPSVPNDQTGVCAAVIVKDSKEGNFAAHGALMVLTIKETLREAGLEGRILVYKTGYNSDYYVEKKNIDNIPKNVPVFVNQSFGLPVNSEIVEKFIIQTVIQEIKENQKPDSLLFKSAQNLLKQYPPKGVWNLSDLTLRDIERKYPDVFNFSTQTLGSPVFNSAKNLINNYYKNGQWGLTLWDIREDPFVLPFVEESSGAKLTNIAIDDFLSEYPNVTIFNNAGNGPNNTGTAEGGPPTINLFSAIPRDFLPPNRFFMVAVGDKKSYDNTVGSYLPRPGSPNRLPVVFQKPTNRTVQGPFYDEPSGRHYIFVDFNGDGHATTQVPVSAKDVKKFNSSGQSPELFFKITWDPSTRTVIATGRPEQKRTYYNNLGPDGSTSTATAQTTAQAAVAACRNPHEPVIRSLFDRIR